MQSSSYIWDPYSSAAATALFPLLPCQDQQFCAFLFFPPEMKPRVSSWGSYMVNTLCLVDSHIKNNFLISLFPLTYCFFSLLALKVHLWSLLKTPATRDALCVHCLVSQHILIFIYFNVWSCLFAVVSCHWGIKIWTHFFHGLTSEMCEHLAPPCISCRNPALPAVRWSEGGALGCCTGKCHSVLLQHPKLGGLFSCAF